MAKKYTQTFTVDRALWLTPDFTVIRPSTGLPTTLQAALLEPVTGAMCCLGHIARQAGVSARALCGLEMPNQLSARQAQPLAGWLVSAGEGYFDNTPLATAASAINDDDALPRRDRERQLKALFADNGIKLVFTGRQQPPMLLTARQANRIEPAL